MQSRKSSYLISFFCFFLLLFPPSLPWAVSAQKNDVTLCCTDNVLKAATEAQCKKSGGKYYTAKEWTKAQKECRPPKPSAPHGASITSNNAATGFCCADGVIQKTTKAQCSGKKGHFYPNNTQARQNCTSDTIFCCVEGKTHSTSISKCEKQGGAIYKSAADARQRCTSVTPYSSLKPQQSPGLHTSISARKPPPRATQDVFPDLSISKFSVSPRQIISGKSVKLTAHIQNSGTRPLQNVTIKYYNTKTKEVLGKDVVSIRAQTSKRSTIAVPLTGKGRTTLSAIVDPDRKIKERNERNNRKQVAAVITQPPKIKQIASAKTLPDISPVTLEINNKSTVFADGSITIHAKIKNSGTKSPGKTISVAFFVDKALIGTKSIVVPANSTRSIQLAYRVKRTGKHIFSVTTDPKNQIAERNEHNNTHTIRLEITPQKTPDHVPGQIIFLVDSTKEGQSLIQKVTTRYNLQIIRQKTLASLQRLLVTCSTTANVQQLARQLQRETGLYISQPNFIFSTMSQIDGDPLRSMQSIDTLVDLDAVHQKSSGKNVLIAIIDTGVDIEHRDLRNRIQEHQNFIVGSAYRGEIHGTAVAGIIAASRNGFGMIGIAPDAELLAYRSCRQQSLSHPEGECYSSSIAEAIDAAIVAKAQITNLSIGSEKKDPLISLLIKEGSLRGMKFVAPVGNNSHTNTISFPASHPQVTAVAGFDETNHPVPNKYLRENADATAPSENIFSSVPDNHHNFFNGTSFSAATITGLMALSLENKENSTEKLPSSNKAILWQNQFSAYIDL